MTFNFVRLKPVAAELGRIADALDRLIELREKELGLPDEIDTAPPEDELPGLLDESQFTLDEIDLAREVLARKERMAGNEPD